MKRFKSIGYIYILSNPSFADGLIKIGISQNIPTEKRIHELNSTGVPTPFKCEYFALVPNYEDLEKRVHTLLKRQRPNKAREFFKVSIDEAIDTIRNAEPDLIDEVVFYRTVEELERIQFENRHKLGVQRGEFSQKIDKREEQIFRKQHAENTNRRIPYVRSRVDEFVEAEILQIWNEQVSKTMAVLQSRYPSTKLARPIFLAMVLTALFSVALLNSSSNINHEFIGFFVIFYFLALLLCFAFQIRATTIQRQIKHSVERGFQDVPALIVGTSKNMLNFFAYEEEWKLMLDRSGPVITKRFADALQERHEQIVSGDKQTPLPRIFD